MKGYRDGYQRCVSWLPPRRGRDAHWWSDKTTAFMTRLHLATKVRQPETFRHKAFEQAATEREMWRL